MTEMITETVPDSDVIGGSNCIVDLIAHLQATLEKVPEEFRSVATIEIEAYDWIGSQVTYQRPITEAEVVARLDRIERQRLYAAKSAENRQIDAWLRNIRLNTGIMDRDDAMEFLRTNPDANHYHPDVFRTGNHGHA
jgi:hypothetical protein